MTTCTWNIERRAANMAAMILHHHIWPEISFAGLQAEGALRTCLRCREVDQCSRWLAESKDDPAAWQQFCPNADLFTRLRRKSTEEMLDDPLIQAVMASDGVQRAELEQLIERLQSR